jgi:hypothetical protein
MQKHGYIQRLFHAGNNNSEYFFIVSFYFITFVVILINEIIFRIA